MLIRSVGLPAGADENRIQAEYANGVLTVRVPVTEEAKSTKTIPIQRAGSSELAAEPAKA